jgi:hypothetical protein
MHHPLSKKSTTDKNLIEKTGLGEENKKPVALKGRDLLFEKKPEDQELSNQPISKCWVQCQTLSQKVDGLRTRCTPLIPALGRQRQVGLCEFDARLVYRVSYRTADSQDYIARPCLEVEVS